MTNSKARDAEERRTFIKQWAEYVRTHDDEEWSRQQKTVVDSQLQSARELAAKGETDPAEFVRKRDEIARKNAD
ncbi:hypothetical protein V5735_17965 (plasmid) [Haladaptatus sp. SPP-AMP-3]|uniref:hypothetical protein n=1 Tax=Haladaptatus sp. SPP-AMP-3 TaxID=3121295 RepID=UPI003C3017BB